MRYCAFAWVRHAFICQSIGQIYPIYGKFLQAVSTCGLLIILLVIATLVCTNILYTPRSQRALSLYVGCFCLFCSDKMRCLWDSCFVLRASDILRLSSCCADNISAIICACISPSLAAFSMPPS